MQDYTWNILTSVGMECLTILNFTLDQRPCLAVPQPREAHCKPQAGLIASQKSLRKGEAAAPRRPLLQKLAKRSHLQAMGWAVPSPYDDGNDLHAFRIVSLHLDDFPRLPSRHSSSQKHGSQADNHPKPSRDQPSTHQA
jgi:hypothetical protein